MNMFIQENQIRLQSATTIVVVSRRDKEYQDVHDSNHNVRDDIHPLVSNTTYSYSLQHSFLLVGLQWFGCHRLEDIGVMEYEHVDEKNAS